MSPRVRLVLYPDGDPAFASHTSLGLKIDLPAEYPAKDVLAAIEEHLRKLYPLASIRAVATLDGQFDETWHVYRDGLPAMLDA